MRGIKFRGKSVTNGKWVYGSLETFTDGKQNYARIKFTEPYTDEELGITIPRGCDYLVNPDTVGQFTGLYDKNNKKIYENDIIELTEKLIDGSGKTTYVGNVVYQNACFHFRMDKINYIILGYVDKKQIKIIGNIHDNPELLKGGEK